MMVHQKRFQRAFSQSPQTQDYHLNKLLYQCAPTTKRSAVFSFQVAPLKARGATYDDFSGHFFRILRLSFFALLLQYLT